MSYINPSPGTPAAEVIVKFKLSGAGNTTANVMSVPALQNMTINNTTDVFTWSQLDEGSKLQVPTTATNSVAMNIVLDRDTFFGSNGNISGATLPLKGLMGVSKDKELVAFAIRASNVANAVVYISGTGYVTNLAPAVTAEQPVFVSPMTLAVTGDYTVGTSEPAGFN